MKISYNLFVFECFWSYIHYTLKAVLPLGITAQTVDKVHGIRRGFFFENTQISFVYADFWLFL